MTYLLDTNFCIAVLRGLPSAIGRMSMAAPEQCSVSVVSLYELWVGVERCQNPVREKEKLRDFISPLQVLPFGEAAAIQTAKIRFNLERIGQPIGPYDLMIAGQAIVHNLTLVTHNFKEFSRVSELLIADWET